MNFRIFLRDADLRDALVGAVISAVESSLNPYCGLIGSPEDGSWLLDRISTTDLSIHLVAHPESLQEEIRSREELSPARQEDLEEPLDVVVILGSRSVSMPPWFNQARAVFVVPYPEQLDEWGELDTGVQPWFFILDNVWSDRDMESGSAIKGGHKV